MGKPEFRHEVMFYESDERFLAGTVPFVMGALEAGEPALVAVSAAKIELLQGELGADAERVRFADMEALGHNPARIIPAWRRFVDEHVSAGAPARGIGEPIWPGRSAVEIDECQRHESLLNVAFGGEPAWSLLCPYDVESLDDEVLEAAAHSHPYLTEDGVGAENGRCRELGSSPDPFAGAFEASPASACELTFDRGGLRDLRGMIAEESEAAGLSRQRTIDLVLAASELAANSVRHGGGHGRARFWRQAGTLTVEISDSGRVEQPLVGRVRPTLAQDSGRGLWMANQLCDLVRIRSGTQGTVVRLHMSLG
ncbi:MAG TPA: sensor histidine kinase [Solirubrobacterales bacterium]|nr:sensor histidine kinase [Solirubrobacterales bacterium]